jgi:hypothetical protein
MADVGGIDAAAPSPAAPASSGVLPSLARLLKPRDP